MILDTCKILFLVIISASILFVRRKANLNIEYILEEVRFLPHLIFPTGVVGLNFIQIKKELIIKGYIKLF